MRELKDYMRTIDEATELLVRFDQLIQDVEADTALCFVCAMFDGTCETLHLDKEEALKEMTNAITRVNILIGDMYETPHVVRKETLEKVLDKYFTVDMRNRVMKDLEEAEKRVEEDD